MSDAVVRKYREGQGRSNKPIDYASFNREGGIVYRKRVEIYPPLGTDSVRIDLRMSDIAKGKVPGAGLIRVVGRNPDVDDTREDVWPVGGTYVFPSDSGERMRVVSTSASDTLLGTGVRTVDIHYLDNNGDQQVETVNMNGLSEVLTSAVNIRRVNDFHTKTAGSSSSAVGEISLTNLAGTTTYSYIEPTDNRARQAVFTVPRGKIALINDVWAGGNSEGGMLSNFTEAYLRATCDVDGRELLPGIFNFKWGVIVASQTAGGLLASPVIMPALCDVKISTVSRAQTSNVRVVAGFSGWYEDDEL